MPTRRRRYSGSAFSAGGNIKTMGERAKGPAFELQQNYRKGIQRLPLALGRPTIADVSCFGPISMLKVSGYDTDQWPNVTRWLELDARNLNRGTSGNVGVRCGKRLLVTPSGVPARELTAQGMVLLAANGDVIGAASEITIHRTAVVTGDLWVGGGKLVVEGRPNKLIADALRYGDMLRARVEGLITLLSDPITRNVLEANPNLTPNMVKAILQYTAEVKKGYDFLTQGAGFLNEGDLVKVVQ